MVLYIMLAMSNLYRLMYPLVLVDMGTISESNLVGPLWDKACKMRMKVYLSSRPKFQLDFLRSGEYSEAEEERISSTEGKDVVLLWEQDLTSASLSKSFLLTTLGDCENESCREDASYSYAATWLDHAERSSQQDAGVLTKLLSSAGEGIESTSVLLTLYGAVSRQLHSMLSMLGLLETKDGDHQEPVLLNRTLLSLSPKSPLWSTLMSNSTLHVHVVVTRQEAALQEEASTFEEASIAMRRAAQSHSLLLGHVDLLKYDVPHHILPPKRILYHDIVYLFQRYITNSLDETTRPPWDMAYSKPEENTIFQKALEMKVKGAGYPYWKPEVAVKYINDDVLYPIDHVGASGMDVVQLSRKSPRHPTGYAQMPALHVDEIGLTSDKYIPINETLTSLPLRISVDRSDMEHHARATTATAGGISPARWRLLSHLSSTLESQKELGFEQSDIDDLRRLIADTNVMLLAITVLASSLHLLFEFLTFKNEVSFWKGNKDLTGLSVSSLFLDMMGQVIILMFLIEKDSSLLMTVPAGIGCLIALWKCQRGAGFKFVPADTSSANAAWWNSLPRMFGYELRATRLHINKVPEEHRTKGGSKSKNIPQDLTVLTIETDRVATRTLGSVLLPIVVAYTAYSFIKEEHTGWYSWLITSASSAVYALGFVLMTPQLFLNYKLKSVAHLPWRVLVYKFLNTFIDDLFAFIIRMPAMARLSCFRDDIVFIIYLYQRWLYPVDSSRPVEGGHGSSLTTIETEKKNQ